MKTAKLSFALFLIITFNSFSQEMPNDKLAIYQLFTRLFGNNNTTNQFYGNRETNGVGKFSDINSKALKSIKQLGMTHVWYTGVIEHATMTDFSSYGIAKDHPLVVKGIAGSPYAIKDYYDINPDLADNVEQRMAEFEALIARTHKEKLKVLIDFIPNHVARQYNSDQGHANFGENDDATKSFDVNNNFYYIQDRQFVIPEGVNPPVKWSAPYLEYPAKATGNDVFNERPNINDWFETVKLNYGIDYLNNRTKHFSKTPDTWIKMRDILLFWASKGVDGFRCDMAEMVPVEFWAWVTKEVKSQYPDAIFIAEIYNPSLYKDYIFTGGFDYLYDKVGLYDALRRLIEGHGNASDITGVWQNESGDYANHMLRFLENHDEQRIASKEFAGDPFKALPAMALSAYLHDGPLMLYFGQELGVNPTKAEGFQSDDGRTTIFDYWGVDEVAAWNNGGKWNLAGLSAEQKELRKAYEDIIKTAQKHEAITSGAFYDLQYVNVDGQSLNYDGNKMYSFLRYTENEKLLFVFNFNQQVSQEFEFSIPAHAWEMMGMKSTGPVLATTEGDKIKFEKCEKINLSLKPNSYVIYTIK
ncbi:Glycosidase [Spirosomataceae bacterium TFI 002]|nr:Glycosidase [Spirosomataceae bacterium TFI 002]